MNARRGIQVIHSRSCPVRGWEKCGCKPGYRAQVFDRVTGRSAYKTFPDPKSAARWRQDKTVALRGGSERLSQPVVLDDLVADWFRGVDEGVIRGRGGHPFKPSVIRSYRSSWERHIRPRLGRVKVGELRLSHVQRMVDELVAAGAAPQTVRNAVTPLRTFIRYALRQELIIADPCQGLELPSGETPRDRIATPKEAQALLAAIPDAADRAVWAIAFYAGLRRGEVLALTWADVDLIGREIRVRRAYDPGAQQFVATKNRRSRTVGIVSLLLNYLTELDTTEGLLFPALRSPRQPMHDGLLMKRAKRAWTAAGLEPISLHSGRHTYASVAIAAGANAKTLSEAMGHSSITVTLDRYGHLMPGAAAALSGLLDGYLESELAV